VQISCNGAEFFFSEVKIACFIVSNVYFDVAANYFRGLAQT
jgi:hypothetical protein